MNKTVIYLVILALLGIGIYYFLFTDTGNPYSQAEAGFTVKDTSAISRIYLAANDGESVLVERTDSGWMVNKKYKAMRSTLNLLLQTISRQAALYPVTKSAYENTVKELSTDGIKVEIYGKDNKKISVFYVGGTAVNNTGTNMMMEGAHTPYVVQMQGFTGYLTPHYSTRLSDWRDRTIFNIPAEEIKSVSVQYAGNALNSFVISRDNGKLTVTGDTRITKTLDSFNSRRANIYLKYFTNINCEGYLNGLTDMDTTLRTAPRQSTIDVEGMHGQRQHVDIYWMELNKRSKNRTVSDPDVPDNYDADRLYAVINNYHDTVLIQQYVFKNMFRKAYEFFQKDDLTQEPEMHPHNTLLHKGQ